MTAFWLGQWNKNTTLTYYLCAALLWWTCRKLLLICKLRKNNSFQPGVRFLPDQSKSNIHSLFSTAFVSTNYWVKDLPLTVSCFMLHQLANNSVCLAFRSWQVMHSLAFLWKQLLQLKTKFIVAEFAGEKKKIWTRDWVCWKTLSTLHIIKLGHMINWYD